MEYLIIAVILYFILQTIGNLVYIIRGGAQIESEASMGSSHPWKGPSPRNETEGFSDHPTFWGEDVEDATWREIDE